MSARQDIHLLFESGRTSYRLDELLDAFKAEVLREAAEKIRGNADKYEGSLFECERRGARLAADMIDPDKDTE